MHPLAERILDGETLTDREIDEFNAAAALRMARLEQANAHDPRGCRIDHCTHGNAELVGMLIDHAAELASRGA